MIRAGYQIALSRSPERDELADTITFINQQMDSYRSSGKSNARELALADFCQILMSLNEFVYVE